VTEPRAGEPAAFARAASAGGAALAGSGADAVAAAISGHRLTVVHRHSAPDIHALLDLATGSPESGLSPPRPLYIRAPDAVPAVIRDGAAR
jgi:hypothetical protein